LLPVFVYVIRLSGIDIPKGNLVVQVCTGIGKGRK
jgi:hypothetical protein